MNVAVVTRARLLAWSRRVPLVVALCCSLLLNVRIASAQSEPKLEHVTLQLKWTHQFQFAGYYAAQAKGFYRDAGLAVEIREARSGEQPMQAVVDGEADFGVGTTDLLLMLEQGAPVVLLANVFQHSPLALMVLKERGISNIHELAAGRLMIEAHSAEIFALMIEEGVSPDDLTLATHTFSTQQLIDGKVDAMSVYSTDERFDLEQRGIDHILFKPIESGIDFYGDNLFTTQSEIDQHPERVERFVAASMRGWTYAMAHPKEIAELIVSRYGTSKSEEHLLFEAEQMKHLINADVVEPGYINPERWERIAERYATVGVIRPHLDLTGFVYDPHQEPDLTLVYRILGISALVAAALIALVSWYMRVNRRLAHEVSERALTQRNLEALNHQKDLLLSIVGHDLKSPFNAILLNGELLASSGATMSPADLRDVASGIRDSATNAHALLENLLNWAALQAGQVAVSPTQVGVADLFKNVVAMLSPQFKSKGIEVDVNVENNAEVFCDERMMETVVRNLVVNAIKYTDHGGSVKLSARTQGATTILSVSDTGVGMTDSVVAQLFARTTHDSTRGTSGEAGTGFGLSLSAELVSANNGVLRASSEQGVGTTLTLELPARPD
jgi:signal transduction histidine kinase